VIHQAGDLGVTVDTGTNAPGVPLQRLEAGQWIDYQVNGKPVCWPVELASLPPGRYRARAPATARNPES
jgi:hypothetical protein